MSAKVHASSPSRSLAALHKASRDASQKASCKTSCHAREAFRYAESPLCHLRESTDSRPQYEVLVIGGGASGLMAAIAAAQAGAKVCIVETGSRVGRSILASGNGRCNLSNELLDKPQEASRLYNDPTFVLPLLTEYTATQMLQIFGDLGLICTADERGCLYPRSNAAASVLQVLRNALKHLGAEILLETRAEAIKCREGSFSVHVSAGQVSCLAARSVVLASGAGELLMQAVGHRSVPLEPVLGPLACNSLLLKGLDGVRVKAKARLIARGARGVQRGSSSLHKGGTGKSKQQSSEFAQDAATVLASDSEQVFSGELHFKKHGLSGIMIFDLSRHAHVGDLVSLDLFPDLSAHELSQFLEMRRSYLNAYTAEQYLDGLIHPRIAASVLRVQGITSEDAAQSVDLHALAHLLKDLRFEVEGLPAAKQAQVMRGGLLTSQFDATTLESHTMPGFFACGEALDIDAACGGYNLHWAWASGHAAGRASARAVQ